MCKLKKQQLWHFKFRAGLDHKSQTPNIYLWASFSHMTNNKKYKATIKTAVMIIITIISIISIVLLCDVVIG